MSEDLRQMTDEEYQEWKASQEKLRKATVPYPFKTKKEWLDPTPAMLESAEFDAIWQVIKTWDINVPDVYAGYCGATGNHVRAILDGLNLMTFTQKKLEKSEAFHVEACGAHQAHIDELENKLKIRQRAFDLKKQRADNLSKDNDRLRQANSKLADEVVKRGGTISG